MNSTNIFKEYLKYAELQLATESFLSQTGNPDLLDLLLDGNNHNSKFTPTAATAFLEKWKVLHAYGNTKNSSAGITEESGNIVDLGCGFSGALFKSKTDEGQVAEYVLSFRSTEFVEDGLRDSIATNVGISDYGWAFGQIREMESWWNTIKSSIPPGAKLTVTGYSLGGHLATAFAQLRREEGTYDNLVDHVYTFNGAGTGVVNGGGRLSDVMTAYNEIMGYGAGLFASLTLDSIDYLSVPQNLKDACQGFYLPGWLDTQRDAIAVEALGGLKRMRDMRDSYSLKTDDSTSATPSSPSTELGDFKYLKTWFATIATSRYTGGALFLDNGISPTDAMTSIFLPEQAFTQGEQFSNMTEIFGEGISMVASGGVRHSSDRVSLPIEDQPLYRGNPILNDGFFGLIPILPNNYKYNDMLVLAIP